MAEMTCDIELPTEEAESGAPMGKIDPNVSTFEGLDMSRSDTSGNRDESVFI